MVVLTLSLPRVINSEFPLQPRRKCYITQYGELGKLSHIILKHSSFYFMLTCRHQAPARVAYRDSGDWGLVVLVAQVAQGWGASWEICHPMVGTFQTAKISLPDGKIYYPHTIGHDFCRALVVMAIDGDLEGDSVLPPPPPPPPSLPPLPWAACGY